MTSASLPMQPVTTTRPFSAIASPIASRLSSLAESRKPQVLTSTTSAPGVIGRHVVAVGAQLGHDSLAVDQGLGTAERDQAHARGLGERRDVHRKDRANIAILRRKLGVRPRRAPRSARRSKQSAEFESERRDVRALDVGRRHPAAADRVRQIEAIAGVGDQDHVPADVGARADRRRTHMSVEIPNATTCLAPSRFKRTSRSVPMKAELTLLVISGSSLAGPKPGRKSLPACRASGRAGLARNRGGRG